MAGNGLPLGRSSFIAPPVLRGGKHSLPKLVEASKASCGRSWKLRDGGLTQRRSDGDGIDGNGKPVKAPFGL